MDDKTLAALRNSIEKWEANAKAKTLDDVKLGILDCPLCDLFFNDDCGGRPVYAKTGHTGCNNTPYDAVCEAHEEWEGDPNDTEHRRTFRKAAMAEVKLLKSLLPEGE